MSLSCSCGEWDGIGWSYYLPNWFTKLKTKRRKRCCSCKELINLGSNVLQFHRFRYFQDKVEERIYGYETEIPIANWYMCEECGEIFLNLLELNFCLHIEDNMKDNLKEYHDMYGNDKAWKSFKEK
jgi:hypothetical protein